MTESNGLFIRHRGGRNGQTSSNYLKYEEKYPFINFQDFKDCEDCEDCEDVYTHML